VGADQDPKNREGWTALLANVDFLSAAGEFPERTIDALAASRPLGWRVEVGDRYTRLTEVGFPSQFPGVLHQMAQRLRAVTPSAKVLAAARLAVQSQLAENYRDHVSFELHYVVPGFAVGDTGAARRYAGGKGVAAADLPEVAAAIQSGYVPANAVLSLAGDLSGSGIDLHRVITNEFGSIPAGAPAPAAPDLPLRPGRYVAYRPDLKVPVGVVGLIAPALSDTTHPSFYLNTLIAGAALTGRWGRSDLIPSPFQYSLFDDPALVRFYPPVTPADVDSGRIHEEYQDGLQEFSKSTITADDLRRLRESMMWMLGGPLDSELRRRAATDPGVLAAISTTSAMRALWGGEAFWSNYLARVSAIDHAAFSRWLAYFKGQDHQIQLIFLPEFLR